MIHDYEYTVITVCAMLLSVMLRVLVYTQADQLWVHPNFNLIERTNDVAMLHLAIPFIFNNAIRNISLDTQLFAAEIDCVIVGYGLTNGRLSQAYLSS